MTAAIEAAVSETDILASEAEDDGVRASVWMRNNACFLFDHVASYVDVSDLHYSSSGLNAYHQGAVSPYS